MQPLSDPHFGTGQCQNCVHILTTGLWPFKRWIYLHGSVTSSSFQVDWSQLGSLTVLSRHHLFQATGATEETLDWCQIWLKSNLDKDQLCPAPFQEVLGAVLSCDLILLLRLWLTTFHTAPSCTCSPLWSVSIIHSHCHRCWQCNCSMGENV